MRCAILLMTLALGCEIPLEAETEFEPSSAQRVGNASLFGVYEGESASEDSDGDAWTITVEAYDCGGYLEGEVTRTGSTSFPVSGTVAGNSIEMTAAEDGQEFALQERSNPIKRSQDCGLERREQEARGLHDSSSIRKRALPAALRMSYSLTSHLIGMERAPLGPVLAEERRPQPV